MTTQRPMQIGMVGLGRMGANLVRRLMRDGHRCVGYARTESTVQRIADEGIAYPGPGVRHLRCLGGARGSAAGG
ncbi:NAD(P)-binding domain-containing protein [Dactylosporangium sp. CA-092794]|uniref:NAD(P)-binding domain-containing protein n=1 Tax=Dactylosporangium sp. CA-092794 TaxID=3239929 RepID=UPI003D912684